MVPVPSQDEVTKPHCAIPVTQFRIDHNCDRNCFPVRSEIRNCLESIDCDPSANTIQLQDIVPLDDPQRHCHILDAILHLTESASHGVWLCQ